MPRRPPRTPPLRAEWASRAVSSVNEGGDVVTPRPLTLSARTAAEAAHGAFRDALRDLGHPASPATNAEGDEERAAGVAGLGAALAPALTLDVEPDRRADDEELLGRLYAAERDGRDAREFPRERGYEGLYAAAGAYARALRREGVGLPAALVAVRATVAADTVRLPAAAHAVVQRDATRCCLEAFYAH